LGCFLIPHVDGTENDREKRYLFDDFDENYGIMHLRGHTGIEGGAEGGVDGF
jgi:hypothetical protein